MTPGRARRLALADVVAELAAPQALERFSVAGGVSALVIDCRGDSQELPAGAAIATACERLAELPCPSLAITGPGLAGGASALLVRCDVAVDSEQELARILATIERTPLAAAALVQLLRQSATLTIHDGLVAESLTYSMLQGGPEFASWLATRPRTPSRADAADPVLVTRNGARLDIALNRPERHNAFSAAMRDALVEALHVAVADPSIGEIVLAGRGPSFSSGGDLDEFGTFPDPASAHAIRIARSPARLLAACADRTRALVHGACIGAGIELPAFATRVISAPDAFFQLPEVTMGLVPGAGGTVSIPRRIGRQRTAYLCLSGVRLDAPTALAWGLVDAIGRSDA